MNIKKLVLEYALQNAVNYNGKANAGAVIGKLLGKDSSLRNQKDFFKLVNEVINNVNKSTLEEQKEQLKTLSPKLLEKKKQEKKELPDIPNAEKGKVIMRFAPNPNGAMSLGHSRTALLNWFFVQKYKGKLILRFDDTDPRRKIPLKEAYKWFKEDLKWLGIKYYKILKQSDRFKIYYKYAEELIKKHGAYICTCNTEDWRSLTINKKPCPCRSLPVEAQLKRWKLMFTEYKEASAVYRVKTNLEEPNPALRDWPAFRIIEHDKKHPVNKINKLRVFPLLNFASAIDDHELKITHILRGVDLQICDSRQKYLYNYFNWHYPATLYNGKLLVSGIKSTSEAKKLIDQGKLDGWDDPRLASLKTLRKRGFQPSAIINFMKELGLHKNDVNVSFDNLVSYNKKILEPSARYFIILNPEKITINNAPKLKVKIPLHTDHPKRGTRNFTTSSNFYIQDRIEKAQIYRFMHLFNFKDNKFISKDLDKSLNAVLIHWLPADQKAAKDLIKVEIIFNDNTKKFGLGERDLKKLEQGGIIQAERIGFLRADKKEKNFIRFYFAHR